MNKTQTIKLASMTEKVFEIAKRVDQLEIDTGLTDAIKVTVLQEAIKAEMQFGSNELHRPSEPLS